MKHSPTAESLAARLRLLELEAGVQRAALIAQFATWEQRRSLAWGSGLAKLGMRVLSMPRVKWMLLASAMTHLKRRKQERKA